MTNWLHFVARFFWLTLMIAGYPKSERRAVLNSNGTFKPDISNLNIQQDLIRPSRPLINGTFEAQYTESTRNLQKYPVGRENLARGSPVWDNGKMSKKESLKERRVMQHPSSFHAGRSSLKKEQGVKEWNYVVVVVLQYSPKYAAEVNDIVTSASKRIADFFGDRDTSLVAPIWYHVEENTLLFAWRNRTFELMPCPEEEIRFVSSKVFDTAASPKTSFVQAFRPKFRLVRAYEERSGQCADSGLINIHGNLISSIFSTPRTSGAKTRRLRARRNIAAGNPPKVNLTLPNFNASYCSLFVYPIPEFTFLDAEDGNTRNLTLSLVYENGSLVGLSSWLQLDSNLQTLYGYLKVSDSVFADSGHVLYYKVRATDSTGLSVDARFQVKIPESPPAVFFKVVLTVNSFEDQSKPYVNEVVFLAYKVIRYFNDNYFTTVNVLDFNRTHTQNHAEETVTFGWTNCTARGPGCPSDVIDYVTKKLLTADGQPDPSFTEKLKPQYNLYNLTVERVGVCLASASSTLAYATPTPVFSLAPIISNPIPELAVYTTQYFSFQIPVNTFYDVIDGNTRGLRLQLRSATNQTLSTSSWMQFNSDTQTMFGILQAELFTSVNSMSFSYTLAATNSRGYSTYLNVALKGYKSTISFGALFSISGRDNSQSTVNDVTILDVALNKLRSYVKDARNDTIVVRTFHRLVTGQQKIFSLVYANATITTSNCNGLQRLVPLLQTVGSLINQELTAALVPEIVADRIDIARYGACAQLQNISIGPSPTPGGLFPVSVNQVPLIYIKTGLFFTFKIPSQTFYDATYGDTTKLSLRVTFSNGDSLIHGSWVQFDEVSQVLYGLLPSSQQTIRPYQNFTFILRATNSLGYSTVQLVTIQSEHFSVTNGIVVTFNGREYNSNQWNDVQLQNFMVLQLHNYFEASSNDTIKIISFQHESNGGSQFVTLWTDSRLNSTNCDFALLKSIESKMFSSNQTVHVSLISKLLPNIILIDAKISYYGECLRNNTASSTPSPSPTASDAPRYSGQLPVVNVTTGLPFTYVITRTTFTDAIDGDTRSLILSVTKTDGSPLTYASPIQFNSSNQVLTGIFYEDILQGNLLNYYHYTLTATNSRNLKTSVPLTVKAEKNQNKPGIIVTTSANSFYSQTTPHLKLAADFLRLLSSYIPNSFVTDFSVISFTHTLNNVGQTTVTWTFNKVNGSVCNSTTLKNFQSLLNTPDGQVNPNFITAMSPNFIVFASTSDRANNCDNRSTSISAITSALRIAPSSSFPLLNSQYLSSTVNTNTPPKVTSKILPLFAYFCSRFSYTIPNDLFRDDEDGDTRSLRLRLETHDRKVVRTSSWLQYSDSSKVLYGILKIDDFYRKPIGGYRFYLIAADKQGLEVSTDFTVTIPDSPLNYNHIATMSVNRVFGDSVPDVNEQLLIGTKILEYFQDSNTNSINVISYQRSQTGNSATMQWSNCSIAYNPCPVADLSALVRKMTDNSGRMTSGFVNAMLPHYSIQHLNVKKLHPCNTTEYTSTISTVSIAPSPSLAPPIPPVLQKPLDRVNISWCAPLQLQIPEKMFSDVYDGATRNLSIRVLNVDGSSIPRQYWLRFDTKTQTILAYPTLNDLLPYETKQFLLTATNRKNLTTAANITVVAAKAKPNPNHQIKVTASAYVDTTVADVDIRILIWNKMKTYFKSSNTELISFSNYSRSVSMPSRVLFTFSFCFLTKDACNRSELDELLPKLLTAPGLINSQFVVAFSPEIVLTDVVVEHVGRCVSYTLAPSLSQATTYVPVTSSAHVVPTNQPPLVLQDIGTLNVDACSVFYYVIPERAFYDVEDGLTQHLRLSVTNANGAKLANDSWITFDPTTRVLKGVYSTDVPSNLQFILTATDKGGLKATQTIRFSIQGLVSPVFFTVNTRAVDYSGKGSRAEILEQFSRKLASYLGGPVQIMSFNKTANQTLVISWTICSQNEWCNATAFAEIQNKLLLTETVLNPNLVIALGPTIMITQVNIQSVDSCPSLVSSLSAMTPTIAIPTAAFTSLQLSPTVAMPNTPPIFVKSIPTLQINSCKPFSKQLPADLCFDREDGLNRALLSIAYKNGTQLSESSLLQFNTTSRTVYGILKLSDISSGGHLREQFAVICHDSKGLFTSKELVLNVTDSSRNETGYSLTFHTYIYPLSTMRNVDVQLIWIRKLQKYIDHPVASLIQFLEFNRLSSIQATLTIRLCSLDMCNSSLTQFLRNKIFSTFPDLNPLFVSAMIPEFSLVSSSLTAPSLISCPILSSIRPHTSFNTPLTSSIVYTRPVSALKSILSINISLCNHFVYNVPEDVFYDSVEGYTSNLTVSIHYENGSFVGQDYWVTYDHAASTITGYAVQDDVLQGPNSLRFKLIARNRQGGTAESLVLLHLSPPYGAVNNGFVTEADIYKTYKSNVELMIEISRKIKAYIGKSTESGLVFTKYTKYNTARPKIIFTWTTCSLIESCDQTTFQAISSKILFSGTILNFQYITALAPNILVTQARIVNSKGCSKAPQSSFPSTYLGRSTQSAFPTSHISVPTSFAQESLFTSAINTELLTPTGASTVVLLSSVIRSEPVVQAPLVPVFVSLCGSLRFRIPENTFLDSIDGRTRNLTVTAMLQNYLPIPRSYWVKFTSISQTLDAQPTHEALSRQPENGYTFIIRATNSRNQYTETPLVLKILNDSSPAQHNVSVLLEEASSSMPVSFVDVFSFLRSRLSAYFGDVSNNNIGILQYRQNETSAKVSTITWYNCSLARFGCNTDLLDVYLSKIVTKNGAINPGFMTVFQPLFKVNSASRAVAEHCPASHSSLLSLPSLPVFDTSTFSAPFSHTPITATRTTTFPMIASSSAVKQQNSAPVPTRPLIISVDYCQEFRYRIPNDVFYDMQDGGTDNLALDLLYHDGNPVNCNTTVQINRTQRELFGTIFTARWNASQIFLLKATDKDGLSATTNVSFASSVRPQFTTFAATFSITITQSACFSRVLQELSSKLRTYLQPLSIGFVAYNYSIKSDHMSVTWTGCSAFDSVCNQSLADGIKRQVTENGTVRAELYNTLLPGLRLESVQFTETKVCSESAISINISLCNKLNYTLSEALYQSTVINTFQNESHQALNFELLAKDGQLLKWINLDKNRIIAIPIYNELKGKLRTVLQLNAKLSNRIIKSLDVVLHHSDITAVQINYTISFTMISYKPLAINDVTLLESIRKPIAEFLNVSSNDVVVVNYNRSRAFPETVQLQVTPCSTLQTCDSTQQDLFTNALALGNGVPTYGIVKAMLPDFVLLRLDVNNTGPCGNRISEDNSTNVVITVPLCTRLYAMTNSSIIDRGVNVSRRSQYDLLDTSKRIVSSDSWVQLDKTAKVIYGVPTQVLLNAQPVGGYAFILRVKDDRGRIKDVKLNITIIGSRANSNYTQTIIFSNLYPKDLPDAKILLTFREKLLGLLQNVSYHEIAFILYRRQFDASQLSTVEYTNCSLLNETNVCSNRTIDIMSTALIGGNGQPSQRLRAAMQPNFTVVNIIEESSHPCRNTSNQPPRTGEQFPPLNVSICARLEFAVPDNAFVDAEDGNASSLVMYLKTFDGKSLPLNSWIQLDLRTRMIYGIPTYDVITRAPLNGYTLRLEAQDRHGAMASVPIIVNTNGNTPNRSVVNVLMETPLLEKATIVEVQRTFLAMSARCLNVKQQDIAIWNYKIIGGTKKEINISIFYNCTYSGDQCDNGMTNELLKRMSTNSTYKLCMNPEFSVIKVDVTIRESCKNATTNTAPLATVSSLRINITACGALYYRIPNDTFTDAEDGATVMSSLRLVSASGILVQKTDFVQLNKTTNTIYALYSRTNNLTQSLVHNYSLEAVDSQGEKTNLRVAVSVPERTQNVTYHICMEMRQYYLGLQTDVDIIIDVTQRIGRFLTNSSTDKSIAVRSYSVSNAYPRDIKLCFTNCSFLDGGCHESSVELFRRRIFLRDGIVSQQFRVALGPELVVTDVSDSYASHCKMSPVKTTIFPTSVFSIALATSSIVATPIHYCLSGGNTAPKVINSVGSLTIYIGRPVVYDIPNDVAYDKEDGYLKVNLTNMDNTGINSDWIYFDENSQRITFSALESERKRLKSKEYFKLVATDSCGTRVYDVLTVTVLGEVSCCYVIQLESYHAYSNWTGSVAKQYEFYKKLVYSFNDTRKSLRLYGIEDLSQNLSKTGVLFTNSSFTNETCVHEQTNALFDGVFHQNGSVKDGFISNFAEFGVSNARIGNSSNCNKTLPLVIPIPIAPPGAAKARTFDDWLWYILPFIILAFLVICCCFLFYWCGACRQTCCGGAKKTDDLFSAAAAQPIQEEISMPTTVDFVQAEQPGVAAVAANALPDTNLSRSPFDDIYTDIDGTIRHSSVPSMHKVKKLSPWMKAARKSEARDPLNDSAGIQPIEEPIVQSAAALPQEAAPDLPDGPVSSAAAAMPRSPVPEQQMTATYSPNTHRRPSYLVSPSSSAMSFDEAPQMSALAPMAQGPAERPFVNEKDVQAVSHEGLQAAPAPGASSLPKEPVTESLLGPANEGPVESQALPLLQQPLSGPLMRLPSTPINSIFEAPPPYSPPRFSKKQVRVTRTRPATQIVERRPTRTFIRLPKRLSFPKVKQNHESSAAPYIQRTRSVESPLKYYPPLESKGEKKRRSLRKQKVNPTRVSLKESKLLHPYRSLERVERFASPTHKSHHTRSFDYLNDYGTDVTPMEGYAPRMPRYGSKDFLDKDLTKDTSGAVSEDQVPVKINGVVKAPEKLLMKWLKDGSLQTTITNAEPNIEDTFTIVDGPRLREKSPTRLSLGKATRKEIRGPVFEQGLTDSDEVFSLPDQRGSRRSRWRKNQRFGGRNMRHDNTALSDIAESTGKLSEALNSRGYPYSKDLYEYVQTVVQPRQVDQTRRRSPSREYLDFSVDNSITASQGQRGSGGGFGTGLTRQKSRRSINEILSRMSRRRELKRKRRAFEVNELHEL